MVACGAPELECAAGAAVGMMAVGLQAAEAGWARVSPASCVGAVHRTQAGAIRPALFLLACVCRPGRRAAA